MDKSLRIALWDANGLAQHRNEIKQIIIQRKIDILLVSETHLIGRNYFKINKNKTQYTAQRKISFYEIEQIETYYIQATKIKIEEANGTLVVAAVYCPPRHTIKQIQFEQYFDLLENRFIAGSDFNAKHL